MVVLSDHQGTASIKSAHLCFPGMRELSKLHCLIKIYNNNRQILCVGEIFCNKLEALDHREFYVFRYLPVFLSITVVPYFFIKHAT